MSSAVVDGAPALKEHRAQVEEAVNRVVADPQFESIFHQALGDGYRSLLEGSGSFSMNLSGSMELIRTQLAEVDPRLAAQLPADKRLEAIGQSAGANLDGIGDALRTLRNLILVSLLVGVFLAGIGISVAERKLRAVGNLGLQLAIYAGLIVAGVLLAGSAIGGLTGISELEGSSNEAWSVVTGGLSRNMIILTVIGVIMAVGGYVGDRKTHPR
jgi:hypothetical protein